jgi:glycosyltransferase involved in cell wall biosynthesis
MKVLRVIASMNPKAGGPPQGIRNLLPSLEAMGVRHTIVCLDSPNADYLAGEDLQIEALGPAWTSFAYSSPFAPWLAKNLSSFDAVICHGLWQYPLFAVRREIAKLRKNGKEPAFFIYPHGMLDPWFQNDPSRKFKAIRNSLYWKLVERKNLKSAAAVLFTCEEERRLAATTFPGYEVHEEVVGYGIPNPPVLSGAMTTAFQESVPNLRAGCPYWLFLSRIHPKKGVDLLIKAYAALVREHLGSSSSESCALNTEHSRKFPDLVIAGPLDSAYASEMKKLAEELLPSSLNTSNFKLQTPRIHFPGMLKGDAKWGAFYGCESFVLVSHQENFGIAVVEALACAKPVLISNKVNIWREIVTGGAGLGEEDSLGGAGALLKDWLDQSESQRAKMSNAAKECFETHYSVEQAANRLVRVLKPTKQKS